MTRFWIGGYGADMAGDAGGIGLLAGDEARPQTTLAFRGTAVEAASPSWIAAHPTLDVVYAALEGRGAVAAFARSGEGTLAPLGEPVAVGDTVCHVAVAPSGSSLIASCYGDGAVVRVALRTDGGLVGAGAGAAATDPYAESPPSHRDTPLFTGHDGVTRDGRGVSAGGSGGAAGARRSHAHAAAFLPDGRLATTDLGFDLVRIWRAAGGRGVGAPGTGASGRPGLVLDHEVVLPRGTGPRHMVVHPSGHLHVVTEHSLEVLTLAAGRDGRWSVVGATSISPVALPGSDAAAELARSRDGATLYAGLRGSDTIAALRVRGDGSVVEPVALADAGVGWPRHHLVHEGALLVAGEKSGTVAVLELDERTGVPGAVRRVTTAPSPTCILPVG